MEQFKILLVEDQAIVMRVHKMMLAEMGYTPDTAENGQQALLMAQHKYDLIFMDIGLPDMMGTEVVTKIRQMANNHATPVIALTAFPSDTVEQECLSVGINKVITKPTTPDILKKIITTYHDANSGNFIH